MTKLYLPITALLLVALVKSTVAQQLPDSTGYKNAIAYFTAASADQAEIYNGNEYNDIRADKGSVFFKDNKEWTMSTIVYQGNAYTNIPVVYDAYSDMMVAKKLNGPIKFILLPDKVNSVQLGAYHFVRLFSSEVKNANTDRYYQELYKGKSRVIARRSKTKSEIISRDEGIKFEYNDDDLIYIKKDTLYYPVKSRGDVLKLFNDKEDALKAYIKSASLNFGQNSKEESFVKLATYYDQLSL